MILFSAAESDPSISTTHTHTPCGSPHTNRPQAINPHAVQNEVLVRVSTSHVPLPWVEARGMPCWTAGFWWSVTSSTGHEAVAHLFSRPPSST